MSEQKAPGLTVLVVEDDEDIRLFMRLSLEELGYRVVEASNGEEAVDMAWRTCPNAILMDLSLPQVDGLTATRRIREDPQMKEVPIVAVTAHHEAQFRANALAAGCSAYTTKPVDINWLDDLLRQLLPVDGGGA
jgi:CheY-like chemotaxis protein